MSPEFDRLLKTNPRAAEAYEMASSPQDAAENVAIVMGFQVEELQKRVAILRSIAPRKLRAANGQILIWRCPDHLIPEP